VPHLTPLANDQASDDARATLESLRTKLGHVPNMYRTLAHAPRVLNAAVAMAQAIRSELTPRLRELAYLKVVQITDCHVCRHYHEALGRKAGLTEEQLRDIGSFEASGAYSAEEKDVLRFAEQWTAAGHVAAEVLARLKASLTPEHLVILAATAAQANFTCRFNNIFCVELP
jgi:AhpD family alkylhydroperoxidase